MTGAVEIGDFECLMFTAYTIVVNRYATGAILKICQAETSKYLPLLKRHRCPWLALTLLQQQCVANLMGETDNPLHLELHLEMGAATKNNFDFQLYGTNVLL